MKDDRLFHTVITASDKEYPRRLLDMKAVFPSFYVIPRCNIDMNDDNIIAVVGTRKATDEGKAMAYNICKILSKNYIITTDLAQGIDYHATLGVLEADGKIIGVRPYLYPIDYIKGELLERMVKNGCIMSKNLMKSDSYSWIIRQFHLCNLVIARIARAIVMIEARYTKHSGTMHYLNLNIDKPIYIWRPRSTSIEYVRAYEEYTNNGAIGFDDVDELMTIINSF